MLHKPQQEASAPRGRTSAGMESRTAFAPVYPAMATEIQASDAIESLTNTAGMALAMEKAVVSTSLDGTLCPVTTIKPEKVPWNPDCSGGVGKWSLLPLHVDGPVLFRYAVVSGRAGDDPPAAPSDMATTPSFGGKTTQDWFVTSAKGDSDGNGAHCTVVGTSWTNSVFVDLEGE